MISASGPAAPALDVGRIRRDFPALQRRVNGRPLVYLDSAATSQKPAHVIEAVEDYYRRYNANVHRGIHALSQEATEAYENARVKVARFVNAPDPACVVFTKNCTEAVNLVAYAWARQELGPEDEILLTEMEHHSNLVPWQLAARDCGASLRFIPVTDNGELELDQLDSLATRRTKLVSVTGMSNVLGTYTDLARIMAVAHSVGALVLVDGAQLVPHAPVDFEALGVDFLAFSGHKMLGPTGIGVLVARREILEEMDPFLGGGEMISDVRLDGSTWNDVPWKFEAGTPPIGEAIGLGAAVDYLDQVGMDLAREHEQELVRFALESLESVKGLKLYGPAESKRRGATFSFNIHLPNGSLIHPHDVGTLVDAEGVAIRAGHHCAKPLMRRFGVSAMCRASCYLYNSRGDIEALVAAIEKARRFFAGEVTHAV
jgi:cysteine desulfurase/selenocysteine lyase